MLLNIDKFAAANGIRREVRSDSAIGISVGLFLKLFGQFIIEMFKGFIQPTC